MAAVDTRVIGLIEVDAPAHDSVGDGVSLLELLDRLMSPATAEVSEQARAESACSAGRLARPAAPPPSGSCPSPGHSSPATVIEADLPRLTAELRVETARLRRRLQELAPAS